MEIGTVEGVPQEKYGGNGAINEAIPAELLGGPLLPAQGRPGKVDFPNPPRITTALRGSQSCSCLERSRPQLHWHSIRPAPHSD